MPSTGAVWQPSPNTQMAQATPLAKGKVQRATPHHLGGVDNNLKEARSVATKIIGDIEVAKESQGFVGLFVNSMDISSRRRVTQSCSPKIWQRMMPPVEGVVLAMP